MSTETGSSIVGLPFAKFYLTFFLSEFFKQPHASALEFQLLSI